MTSASPLDFGHLIAFLVPGFVALFAITYISPEAKVIFEKSLETGSGVGAELGIGLFSIGIGVTIGAIRDMILDQIQFHTGVVKHDLNWSKLSDKKTAAFDRAVNNTYRFAQFYGNMFIATLILVASRIITFSIAGNGWPTTLILVVALFCLFLAHRYQLRQTYNTLNEILT